MTEQQEEQEVKRYIFEDMDLVRYEDYLALQKQVTLQEGEMNGAMQELMELRKQNEELKELYHVTCQEHAECRVREDTLKLEVEKWKALYTCKSI